jgi:membrane-associated protein
LGYFLGNISVVRKNIDLVLVLIVVISLIPMGIEFLNHRRQAKASSPARAVAEEIDPA